MISLLLPPLLCNALLAEKPGLPFNTALVAPGAAPLIIVGIGQGVGGA